MTFRIGEHSFAVESAELQSEDSEEVSLTATSGEVRCLIHLTPSRKATLDFPDRDNLRAIALLLHDRPWSELDAETQKSLAAQRQAHLAK